MKLVKFCISALLVLSIFSPAPVGAVSTSLGAGLTNQTTTANDWSAHAIPMLAGSGFSVSYVAAVGCPHAGLCVAMGTEGKDPGSQIPVIITDTNGVVDVMKSPVPADSIGSSGSIDYMACQVDGRCTGVGQYNSSKGTRGWILSGSGTHWTASTSPDVPSFQGGSISCPPSGNCIFAGDYLDQSQHVHFVIVTGHDASWSSTEIPAPAEATVADASEASVKPDTVGCDPAGSCVLVGEANWVIKKTGRSMWEPVVITGAGSSWTARKLSLPSDANTVPDAGPLLLGEMSCYAPGECETGGRYYTTGGAHNRGLLLSESKGPWVALAVPLPPGVIASQTDTSVEGAACRADGSCVSSVAGETDSGTQSGFLLVRSNGVWRTAPIPSANGTIGTFYSGWRCPAVGDCVGVDGGGRLLTASNGTFSAVQAPLPDQAGAGAVVSLDDAACAPSGGCVASGNVTWQGDEIGVIWDRATGPTVTNLSLHELPVNDSAAMTITGTGFKGASFVSWRCPNGSGGFGIGSKDFTVNKDGTEITIPATPAPVDKSIVQYASACGYQTDQADYTYDITVEVKSERSVPLPADRFQYLGPDVTGLTPGHADVDVVTPIQIHGRYLRHVDAVVWRCPASSRGFYYSGNGFTVNGAGTRIDMSSPNTVDASIAGIASRCAWQTDQQSYEFQVRARIGQLYSPPESDTFSYDGPRIDSLNIDKVAVGDSVPLAVTGSGLEAATQVEWACVGKTKGPYYGRNAFRVNNPGTRLALQTPTGVQNFIAQFGSTCGFQLDQLTYPFEMRIRVGKLFSPRVRADAFNFQGPRISALNIHTLKINAVAPFTVQGQSFQKATAVAWICATGVHGFHIGTHDPGVTVFPSGTQIQMKTNPKVSTAIATASKACGFKTGQKSYPFDIRVEVGPLYSPRVAADAFTYHR